MIKINGLINKDGFIKDQYKKYCEQNFKIELYSLNFFLKSPYIEHREKTPTINKLDHFIVECEKGEDTRGSGPGQGRGLGERFSEFVGQIKSGEKLTGVFGNYIKERDYFFKKDEHGALVDILVSFEFLMDVRIYYFEC